MVNRPRPSLIIYNCGRVKRFPDFSIGGQATVSPVDGCPGFSARSAARWLPRLEFEDYVESGLFRVALRQLKIDEPG